MILSFADAATERLYRAGKCHPAWKAVESVALRKLDMVAATTTLLDLRSPPGNRLETLKGDRAGQHSIRINDKWRICFRWTDRGAANVEITDYHRG